MAYFQTEQYLTKDVAQYSTGQMKFNGKIRKIFFVAMSGLAMSLTPLEVRAEEIMESG